MCTQSIGYAWMCWQSSVWDVHSASFRSTAYAGFRRKDVSVCACRCAQDVRVILWLSGRAWRFRQPRAGSLGLGGRIR